MKSDEKIKARREWLHQEVKRNREREHIEQMQLERFEEECKQHHHERQNRHRDRGWGPKENYAPVPDKEDLRSLLNEKNDTKEQAQEQERAPKPPQARRLLMAAAPGEGRLLPAPPSATTSKEPDGYYKHYTQLVNKGTSNYVEPRSNLKQAHMGRGWPSLTPTNLPQQKSPKLKAKGASVEC